MFFFKNPVKMRKDLSFSSLILTFNKASDLYKIE